MKFLLATKQEMTQYFSEDGKCTAATLLSAGPVTVTALRNKDKDGYEAVQFGFGTQLPKRVNKPQQGALKELGVFRYMREYRPKTDFTATAGELKVGDKLDASVFAIGDKIKVTGMSKGKGFQGVMKRHGFSGMPHSHGHHHVARHAGSIGQRFPQHTLKGMRMAGRMGTDQVTTRGLKIVRVDVENGLLAVKGAIPGNRGQLLIIQSQ